MRRLLTALGIIAVSSVTATATVAATADAAPRARAASASAGSSRLVQVDGYSLAVSCTGEGKKTVVLLSGFGDALDIWSGIQGSLSRQVRVCSYDRPGEGASGNPVGVQNLGTEAALLHDLLGTLGIGGKVYLVAHSLGGDIAVYFAQHYLAQVAGVVLLDATPVNYLQFVERLIPPTATGLAGALLDEAVTTIDGDNSENFEIAGGNWATPGSLGSIPLVVAEHGQDIFAGTGVYDRPLQATWAAGQARWTLMSHRSKIVVATQSGHYIYLDQPQLTLSLIEGEIGGS